MKSIQQRVYRGERPLFAERDLRVESVRFDPGESPLKHCVNVEAVGCEFLAKYPLWHGERLAIEACTFRAQSRAAIWYSSQVRISACAIDAPKMFRRVEGLRIEDCRFSDAAETGWNCRDVSLADVEIRNGDYLFMNGEDIRAENLRLQGNYVFDGARNVQIRNAVLDSKDAFWNSENVTVIDSVLDGEYLGWHSRNLRLVNRTIRGTQPLCFATGLVIENCVMEESCDLCFEHSSLQASIRGAIPSVRNPRAGWIEAGSIGTLIVDEHALAPGQCEIRTRAAVPLRELTC